MGRIGAIVVGFLVVTTVAFAAVSDLEKGLEALARRDYAEAMRLLLIAAERGQATAEMNIALLHLHGQGVSKDVPQAAHWFRRAAARGSATAQVELGYLLRRGGEGLPKDLSRAIYWLERAAAQGDGSAQLQLVDIYLATDRADFVEALAWLEIAATHGDGRQRDTAATMLKAAPDLGPTVRQGAQARVKAWRKVREVHSFGSGFFVSSAGHVLTALANVEGCAFLEARLDSETTRSARRRAVDETNQLALLEVPTGRAAVVAATFGEAKPPRLNDAVVVMGPAPPSKSLPIQSATATIAALASPDGDSRFFQIVPVVKAWYSGGAVVDAAGAMIGVALESEDLERRLGAKVKRAADKSLVIKATTVADFLETNGIRYRADKGSARTLVEARDKIFASTVMVECVRLVPTDKS